MVMYFHTSKQTMWPYNVQHSLEERPEIPYLKLFRTCVATKRTR